jgi:uracil-DNA glycosylase
VSDFDQLLQRLRSCAVCRDTPRYSPPLPHDPRPVIQAAPDARICIVGQAPGIRVNNSGIPFTDPSGMRLRQWLGIDEQTLHDSRSIAIAPMGLCFPGNDAEGGDLPPRRECAEIWHGQVMSELPQIELLLLIGQYAQHWHLDRRLTIGGVTGTVHRWREIYDSRSRRRIMPLPHPSWRNTGWIKRNPWFERELIPVLRTDIAELLR